MSTIKLEKERPVSDITLWTEGSHLCWCKTVWSGREEGTTEDDVAKGTVKAAEAALQRLAAKYRKEGWKDEVVVVKPEPAAPVPSKPRSAPQRPAWLARLPPEGKKQHARLLKLLAKAKLSHRAAEIEALLAPGIGLAIKKVKPAELKAKPVSRMGGDPDVPADFAWPRNEGVPLGFLAQIALPEVTRQDLLKQLPGAGVLSFFASLEAGPDSYGQLARAFHFPSSAKLVRTPHPAPTPSPMGRVALLLPSVRLTLPGNEDPEVCALRLTSDESDAYNDEVILAFVPDNPVHQLLGYGSAMTGFSLEKKRHLAQFDSDSRVDFDIGDFQTLWMYVTAKALAAKKYDRVVCCMEQN